MDASDATTRQDPATTNTAPSRHGAHQSRGPTSANRSSPARERHISPSRPLALRQRPSDRSTRSNTPPSYRTRQTRTTPPVRSRNGSFRYRGHHTFPRTPHTSDQALQDLPALSSTLSFHRSYQSRIPLPARFASRPASYGGYRAFPSDRLASNRGRQVHPSLETTPPSDRTQQSLPTPSGSSVVRTTPNEDRHIFPFRPGESQAGPFGTTYLGRDLDGAYLHRTTVVLEYPGGDASSSTAALESARGEHSQQSFEVGRPDPPARGAANDAPEASTRDEVWTQQTQLGEQQRPTAPDTFTSTGDLPPAYEIQGSASNPQPQDDRIDPQRERFRPTTLSVPQQCPICLDNWSTGALTSCNHFFCEACLTRWLRDSRFCPICRTHLREPHDWIIPAAEREELFQMAMQELDDRRLTDLARANEAVREAQDAGGEVNETLLTQVRMEEWWGEYLRGEGGLDWFP